MTPLEHLKETLVNISIGIYQKVAEDIAEIEHELTKISDENHIVVDTRVYTPVDSAVFEELKKEDKVLKIIVERRVNLDLLNLSFTVDEYNLRKQIINKGKHLEQLLTQEEFELLKEVII